MAANVSLNVEQQPTREYTDAVRILRAKVGLAPNPSNTARLVALLAAHPAIASEKSASNTTLLHEAIANRAPVEVVNTLLAVNPAAVAEKNNDAWTPLHTAALSSAPVEIVRALLRASGAAGIPLNGHTPLGMAISKKASDAVVMELLVAHPDAAGMIPAGQRDELPPAAAVLRVLRARSFRRRLPAIRAWFSPRSQFCSYVVTDATGKQADVTVSSAAIESAASSTASSASSSSSSVVGAESTESSASDKGIESSSSDEAEAGGGAACAPSSSSSSEEGAEPACAPSSDASSPASFTGGPACAPSREEAPRKRVRLSGEYGSTR